MVGLIGSYAILHMILQILQSYYDFKLYGEMIRITILTISLFF